MEIDDITFHKIEEVVFAIELMQVGVVIAIVGT